jgi:hypothetical protein
MKKKENLNIKRAMGGGEGERLLNSQCNGAEGGTERCISIK